MSLSSSFGADCASWVSMRSASTFFFMNSSVAFCASGWQLPRCARASTGDDPGTRIVGVAGCGAGCAYALCCTGAGSGFAVCITGGMITGASTVSRSTGTSVSGVFSGLRRGSRFLPAPVRRSRLGCTFCAGCASRSKPGTRKSGTRAIFVDPCVDLCRAGQGVIVQHYGVVIRLRAAQHPKSCSKYTRGVFPLFFDSIFTILRDRAHRMLRQNRFKRRFLRRFYRAPLPECGALPCAAARRRE